MTHDGWEAGTATGRAVAVDDEERVGVAARVMLPDSTSALTIISLAAAAFIVALSVKSKATWVASGVRPSVKLRQARELRESSQKP